VAARMTAAGIRVMIVDDHVVVREGLESVLAKHPDIAVVSSVATGEAALVEYQAHRPDVVLLDVRLPGPEGLAVLAALLRHDRHARVVMISSHQGNEAIYRALKAGAMGYVFKSMSSSELVAAIRGARTGRPAVHQQVADKLNERNLSSELSEREIGVLRRVAQGQGNKDIAAALGISAHTVKNHMNNVMAKLSAADRTQAVTIAVQRGIIDLE
jgi:DNA-binding NarL/FixJ family response regulator